MTPNETPTRPLEHLLTTEQGEPLADVLGDLKLAAERIADALEIIAAGPGRLVGGSTL